MFFPHTHHPPYRCSIPTVIVGVLYTGQLSSWVGNVVVWQPLQPPLCLNCQTEPLITFLDGRLVAEENNVGSKWFQWDKEGAKLRNAIYSASSQKEANGPLIVRRLLAGGNENSRERIIWHCSIMQITHCFEGTRTNIFICSFFNCMSMQQTDLEAIETHDPNTKHFLFCWLWKYNT